MVGVEKVQTAAWVCVFGLPWPGCGGRPCSRSTAAGVGWGPMQRFALQAVIKKKNESSTGAAQPAASVGFS